ncbi:hypothetical protein GGH95_000404, partial [Coemansia sp. RSA 1836]
MHERSTWDLFYTVPAVVPASEGGEEEGVMSCVTVVSVGELTSLVVHPRDATKKIFRYVMSTATPACTLGFAAGPFTSACTLGSSELRQKPPLAAAASAAAAAAVPLREKEEEKDEDDEDEDEGDDEGEGEGDDEDESAVVVTPETVDAIGGIYAFATGGSSSSKDALGELQHTCAFLPEALGFIAQEFGAYPYSSYKIVFIENLRTPTVTCASLTLVDASLLHPAAVIDAAYEARRVLGLAAAAQWFGAYVAAAARADRWLVAGLAGFAAAAYARHSLGRSEHRWRLRRDVQRLCHADVNQRALAAGGDAAFVALKAPLVLHMLDARMRRGGRSLGLARMAAQALGAVAAAAQPLATTAWFLRGCRRVSGVDVGAFAEQWVYGTGCPVLHVACAFNRKKLAVEITVHQESTNARATAPWVRPQQLFRGPLTARIREADGTPYEHVLDIGERVRRFEVQFNTKYKRIRRATKRFHTRQHDQVLIGAESPRAKRAWRAVEWGEADAESLASAAFEWIRVDPDQEWACVVHFAQPAFMWAAQLQRDRDVAAQADAVAALQRLPSAAASTALMRAVMDARMFFRVRVAAALALAVLATERLAWIGLHHLVQIYAARYSSAGDPGADLGSSPIIPRPNDFRDFGEYFTQRAVLAALSNVRGGGRRGGGSGGGGGRRGGGSGGGGGNNGGVAPAPARRVLLAALRYNDNSANAYADGHYLAGLAAAVANSVVCGGDDDSSSSSSISATLAALAEVERLRALDVLVPSFHNVVTCAALDAVVRVSLAQPRLHVFNAALFAAANGRHAFDAVRRVAACGLLLHWGPRTPQCARMLAASAADARHPRVAAALARAAAQLMMLQAAALGRSPLAHNRSLMAEASASASASAETKEWDEHVDAPARLVGGFEALVDDALGDSLELRVILASAAYDSALPPDTRRMLAAIHALVYQTVDESVPQKPQKPRPRLKIRLQPKTQPKPLPSEELPPKKGGSPMSSDSEDTPLGALLGVVATSAAAAAAPPPPLPLPLKPPRRKYQRKAPLLQRPSAAMVSDELVSIDDDDDDDNAPLMLPAIAGTRPPPLVSPDASLNSPVYAGGAPPIKLKLKLSKVASSAVIDTISSSAGGGGGSPLSKEIPREKEIPRDVSKEKEIPPTLTIPPPPPSLPPPIPPPLLPPQPSVAPVAPTDSLHASSLDDPTRKHLHRVLRKFSRHPDAFPFTRPVDILLDGCPTYYDVIKQPMDLSTIKRNLESNRYSTAEEFERDVRLMLDNCFKFNPPGTPVHLMGESVLKLFDAEWKKMKQSIPPTFAEKDVVVPPKLTTTTTTPRVSATGKRKSFQAAATTTTTTATATATTPVPTTNAPSIALEPVKSPSSSNSSKRVKTDDNATNKPDSKPDTKPAKPAKLDQSDSAEWMSLCTRVLLRLQAQPSAIEFMAPVDPIKQGVPTYFDVIKQPIDLSTIRTKLLVRHAYKSPEEFKADVELLFSNCFLFNTPGTYVHTQCETLQ